jgi:hypothetical protein
VGRVDAIVDVLIADHRYVGKSEWHGAIKRQVPLEGANVIGIDRFVEVSA